MERDYFNQYYKLEREHWWFKVREEILKSQLNYYLEKNKEQTIMNVGAATGRSSEMLNNFGKVTSIEYDKIVCDLINAKTNLNYIHASITELPFPDNSFDVICAFDVIEHVEKDLLAIKELKRVCKKEGYIFVTVPAFNFLWSQHDLINHHFRRYNSKQLTNLFLENSLNKVKTTYFNTLLFIPISIYRIFVNRMTKLDQKPKSDFSTKFGDNIINKLLKKIFGLEVFLLKNLNFPFGVSILSIWKK